MEIKFVSFNGNYSTYGRLKDGRWQEFVSEEEYEETLADESEFQKILSGKLGGDKTQRKRPRISAIKDICTVRSLNHLECKNCEYYDDAGCAEFKEVFKTQNVDMKR